MFLSFGEDKFRQRRIYEALMTEYYGVVIEVSYNIFLKRWTVEIDQLGEGISIVVNQRRK